MYVYKYVPRLLWKSESDGGHNENEIAKPQEETQLIYKLPT